jgi:DNA-binding transcriptional LysR family regulator
MSEQLLLRSGLSLERLRSFCAIAEAGSIVGAAGGDLPRQSLMSRQIRELEEFFETELIRRQGRGIVITEAGKHLAAMSREFFKALGEFTARAHDLPAKFSFVAPNSINQWLIIPRLAEIQKRLPEVTFSLFHLQTREIIQSVQECVHDFGIAHEEAVPKTLQKRVLGVLDYRLFVPGDLAKSLGKEVWSNMDSLPLALPIGGQLREALDQKMKKRGRSLKVRLECSSYLDALRALRSAAFAAILPGIARVDLQKGTFVEYSLPGFAASQRTICLVWSKRVVEMREKACKVLELATQRLTF